MDGDRAAPPEDYGHLVDADNLAEVLPDPARFRGPYFVLRESGIDTRLVDLVHQLSDTVQCDSLTAAALTLVGPAPLDAVAMADSLRGVSVVPRQGPPTAESC